MLRVTIQDLHNNSPRCVKNCAKYKVEGCGDNCTSRFRITFSCPHCKVVKCFYGGNNPLACSSCKKLLPDMYLIKRDGDANIRVKYHLEEGE